MKNLRSFAILSVCALSFTLSYAQTKPTKAEKKAAKLADIKRIIDSKNYIFKADYVVPMSMTARTLTANYYDVTLKNDSLVVDLPYFGRAYSPPRDPTQGGFKLTTTDYDYTSVANKKGGWDIVISPKKTTLNTVKDVRTMRLSVSNDGYASLQLTSFNRQPISYNGTIEEVKKPS